MPFDAFGEQKRSCGSVAASSQVAVEKLKLHTECEIGNKHCQFYSIHFEFHFQDCPTQCVLQWILLDFLISLQFPEKVFHTNPLFAMHESMKQRNKNRLFDRHIPWHRFWATNLWALVAGIRRYGIGVNGGIRKET